MVLNVIKNILKHILNLNLGISVIHDVRLDIIIIGINNTILNNNQHI